MSATAGRLCPCLNSGSGSHRAARCAGSARRTGRAHLRRSRPDRHHRDRPGLREALAACRSGDTLVVTKLDRLARSLPDTRDILEDLTTREVKLSIGGSVHDPTDPVGRLLFNVLAMVAEFESDLIRLRTRSRPENSSRSRCPRGRARRWHPRRPRARTARRVACSTGTASSGRRARPSADRRPRARCRA